MITMNELVLRARALAAGGKRAILGIAGSPGAGKTTLTEYLVRSLREGTSNYPLAKDSLTKDWVAHVPMDGFHLSDRELVRLGRLERKGAPDTFDVLGYTSLLYRIRSDEANIIYAPSFERELEQPLAASIPIFPSTRLVVTEGNYLLLDQGLWVHARELFDEVWYCELEDEERIRRLVVRHERFGKDHEAAVAWVRGPDQRNAELVDRTRARADLVIPAAALDTFGGDSSIS